jgi:maleylpyruvate isomerase
LSAADLVEWLRASAEHLRTGLGKLTTDQVDVPVRTGQGRTIPARDIAWLRAREVCVHAVDLDLGVTFADLPEDFLAALCADVEVTRRRDWPPDTAGPLHQRVAWLTGRPHSAVLTDGSRARDLGPWL